MPVSRIGTLTLRMLKGWYSPEEPPAALAPLLVCSWTALPSGSHTLVPDGCIDVLWITNGSIWVCGPETTAWSFALPAGTAAVGVRFRPGACPTAFGFDASRIVNRRVPLSDYIGADHTDTLSRTMAETMRADDLSAGLRAFEAEFIERLGGIENDLLADAIVEHLSTSPRATQQELADTVGVTSRQLHRRSLALFGYGTTMLARLMRFQRCLALAGAARHVSLARLAVDAGYSDHAHLVRDCRAITGDTPSRFLASYFPTFPDMSDPYKTEAAFDVSMAR